MTKTRVFRAIVAFCAMLALFAPAGERPRVASAQSDEVIKLGNGPFEANGAAYYAQEMGFFKRAGLNVEVTVSGSGAATLAAIIGGSLHIGGGNPLPVAQARQRGIKVLFVAPGYLYDWADPPGSALVVAPGSSIQSAKDLNGKTVAITSVPSIDNIASNLWIDKFGGDSSTIKYIELPPSAMADAVSAGRVDAAVIGNPALSAALESSKVRLLARCYDAIGKHVMVSGWFATEEWATKHPDQVRRFQAAINQGAAWAVQNPEAAAQVLVKVLKVSMTRAHEYHARTLDPALLQPVLDGAARYKFLTRPMEAREIIFRP